MQVLKCCQVKFTAGLGQRYNQYKVSEDFTVSHEPWQHIKSCRSITAISNLLFLVGVDKRSPRLISLPHHSIVLSRPASDSFFLRVCIATLQCAFMACLNIAIHKKQSELVYKTTISYLSRFPR